MNSLLRGDAGDTESVSNGNVLLRATVVANKSESIHDFFFFFERYKTIFVEFISVLKCARRATIPKKISGETSDWEVSVKSWMVIYQFHATPLANSLPM